MKTPFSNPTKVLGLSFIIMKTLYMNEKRIARFVQTDASYKKLHLSVALQILHICDYVNATNLN
jgi:hypothetical protein